MPLSPAIIDLEQLKNHPAVAKLMAWNPAAVEGAKFDCDEMSIYVSGRQSGILATCCARTRIVPSTISPTSPVWTGFLQSRVSRSSIICSRF